MKWPVVGLSEALASAEVFVDGDWVESKDQDPEGDVRLVQLADVGDGEYIDKSDRFLTSAKARELRCTYLQPGDVMVARMPDPLGRACIFPGDPKPSVTVVDVCIIRPDDRQHDARWLMHCLNAPACRNQIAGYTTGTTRSRISRGNLGKIKIPLPPLAEQRRIAEVLDRAETLRAKRRAALAHLDSLAQSLFLDLFGDPATNPKGWPKATLGDVTEMVTGYPFRSEEYITNGDSIRLCRGANILPGRIDWSDLACWPESKTAELAEFSLEAGDVVIAMDRPWISEGFKIARVHPEDCPALLVQRVARLRGRNEIPNEFLFHLLNQPAFTRHCRPTETTIPHISPKDIRSCSFHFPPPPLQREFARRVSAVEKLKTAQRASLAELDALFASLQHRAFRGEL